MTSMCFFGILRSSKYLFTNYPVLSGEQSSI